MEDRPSMLWNIALVFSLLFLAAVCYGKIEPFRNLVDTKCPWIKEQLVSRGIEFPARAAGESSAMAGQGIAASSFTQPVSKSIPAANRPRGDLSLAQIAADRSLWPQTVRLKKTTIFPAVVNGKKVGELNVPAGTEVKVMQISVEKIGVAYSPNGSMANAGGTWLTPDETSLVEQVRSGQ